MLSKELYSVSFQIPISPYIIAPMFPDLPQIVQRFHNIVCLKFSNVLGDLDQTLTLLAQEPSQNLQ